MACLSLLFIATLTTVSKVTSLHCSDQQLPASGDDDLQQVTTLQYCLVDNCTIMIIDTGEELDIVYTINSLIVTTPTDGRTSVLIAKQETELLCPVLPFQELQFSVMMIACVLAMLTSGFVIVMHLVFKQLQTTLGKLLILYNFANVCYSAVLFLLCSTFFVVSFASLALCYSLTFFYIVTGFWARVFATCMLHHVVYVMYCSSKLVAVTPEMTKRCYKQYTIFQLIAILLMASAIVSFDVATGNYRGLLRSDGHCVYITPSNYSTIEVSLGISGINYVAQLVLFIAYMYYIYELSKDVDNPEILDNQQSMFRKIGFIVVAAVGLSYLVYALHGIFSFQPAVLAVLALSIFLAQQCTFMAILLCSKKMRRLYRGCFSKD